MGRDRCLCPFDGCSKSFGRYERLQRHLLACHASPSRHREMLPSTSDPSGRDVSAKSTKRASCNDGDVGETARPGFSSKQAVRRRKRQKAIKKLYVPSEARSPSEGPSLPNAIQHSTNRGLSRVPTWVTSPASVSVSRQPSPAQDLIDELESENKVEHASIPLLEAREYHVQEKPVAAIRSGIAGSPFDRLGGMCRRRPIALSPDPPIEPQQVASTSDDTFRQGRRRSFPLSDDSDDSATAIFSRPGRVGSRDWHCPPAFEPFMRYAFDTPPPGGFVSAKTTSESGASDARVNRNDLDRESASTLAMATVEVVDKLRQDCRVEVEDSGLADNRDGRKDIFISHDLHRAEESESGAEQRSVSAGSNLDDLDGAENTPQVACQPNHVRSSSPAGSLAGPSTPASRSFNTASELGTPLSASIVERILGDSKVRDHPPNPAGSDPAGCGGHVHLDIVLETASSIFLAIGGALGELVRARRSACQCDKSGGRRSSQEISSNSLELPETPPTAKHHLKSLESGVGGAPPTPCSPER